MGISFTIHPDRQLAYFRIDGEMTVRLGTQVFRDYARHPQHDPGHVLLTNASALSKVDADFQSICKAVLQSMSLIRLCRQETRSIIYAPTDLAFGISRLLQQVVEPVSHFRFEITRDEAHALAAAGQPERGLADLELNLRLQPEGV